jgi:hypothetical protein
MQRRPAARRFDPDRWRSRLGEAEEGKSQKEKRRNETGGDEVEALRDVIGEHHP